MCLGNRSDPTVRQQAAIHKGINALSVRPPIKASPHLCSHPKARADLRRCRTEELPHQYSAPNQKMTALNAEKPWRRKARRATEGCCGGKPKRPTDRTPSLPLFFFLSGLSERLDQKGAKRSGQVPPQQQIITQTQPPPNSSSFHLLFFSPLFFLFFLGSTPSLETKEPTSQVLASCRWLFEPQLRHRKPTQSIVQAETVHPETDNVSLLLRHRSQFRTISNTCPASLSTTSIQKATNNNLRHLRG